MSRYDSNGVPVHHANYPSGVSVRDIDDAAEGRRRRVRFGDEDDDREARREREELADRRRKVAAGRAFGQSLCAKAKEAADLYVKGMDDGFEKEVVRTAYEVGVLREYLVQECGKVH